jgi:class 3 adenylate cyclase
MSEASQNNRRPAGLSLRWRITLPYILLAFILGLGATVVVNRLLNESEQQRFWRQLSDSGKQATNAVVRTEDDLLRVERLISNTEGVIDAAALADAEGLRERVLPLVVNANLDAAAILDRDGNSLLAVRHRPDQASGSYERAIRGESFYADWGFVQQVLNPPYEDDEYDDWVGDKRAGLEGVYVGDQEVLVFFIAGPLRDAEGQIVGAVLVGQYIDSLAKSISVIAGANISIYSLVDGNVLVSTLEAEDSNLLKLSSNTIESIQNPEGNYGAVRTTRIAGSSYGEVLTPLQVRNRTETLGVMGISLIAAPFESAVIENAILVARIGAISLLAVVAIGLLIANSITRPLRKLARAANEVADGNLDTIIPEKGGGEIVILAHSMNRLVKDLRESMVYSGDMRPSLSDEAQTWMQETENNETLPLEGQFAVVSVLAVGLKGFSEDSLAANASELVVELNELINGIPPIISEYGGTVSGFDGNVCLANFGFLPHSLPPKVSTLQAAHAAMEIISFISERNKQRAERGLAIQGIGIGVSTGEVIAGVMGISDCPSYMVVGETVRIAYQIEQLSCSLKKNTLLVDAAAYRYLRGSQQHFEFGRSGKFTMPGSDEDMLVHEIRDRKLRLID